MQYWQYEGHRVFHEKFGYGTCTGTEDGNIVVVFDEPTEGYSSRSLQHTSVQLAAQQGVESDECPRCVGKRYFLIGSDECKCLDCNGTGIRR